MPPEQARTLSYMRAALGDDGGSVLPRDLSSQHQPPRPPAALQQAFPPPDETENTHAAMASSLCILLASCSAARPSATTPGPTGPLDLTRYVLIVQESPSGEVTHDWRPFSDFDLTKLPPAARMSSGRRHVVRVSSGLETYCGGRRAQCETDCLSSSRPMRVGHLRYPTYRGPWRVNRGWWCPQACGQLEDMCNRGMGEWADEYAAEFDAIEPAVDWLKRHREEILVGTLIVIAGVTFVAAVAASGGGAVVLVPLVMLAEDLSGSLPVARTAEAGR